METALWHVVGKTLIFLFYYFRPFFTYWISFVQLIVLTVGLAVYGLAPIGFTETVKRDVVIIHELIPIVYYN